MQLGQYRLIERIGAGGMGEVWRAEDTQLLRSVAIKLLGDWVVADPSTRSRFLREAQTAARLNHPFLATIYQIGEEGSRMYIAMELVRGDSLTDLIARGLTVPHALRIARQTLEGLAAAHIESIIHRDVKPDNIVVQPSSVKILDFGIAKMIGPSALPTLTVGNMAIGTPDYMSPEQAMGARLDARSDIFSLGAVLFEMLTGKRPFTADTFAATMMKVVTLPAPDPRTLVPSISDELAAIVLKAMEKKRENRFQSADEMAAALTTVRIEREVPPLPVAAEVRALIADSDGDSRRILRGALDSAGIGSDEATNGADAVRRLREQPYAFVFLALFLPRVDGWEVLDFIRREKLEEQMRIFVLSSSSDQHFSPVDRETISAVLQKPLDAAEVRRVVVGASSVWTAAAVPPL